MKKEITSKKSAPIKPGLHTNTPLFNKENYKLMLLGIIVMAIGFILMSGGKSPDPNVFNADEVYSTRRIVVAPIVVILGFAIEIYAVFHKSKK